MRTLFILAGMTLASAVTLLNKKAPSNEPGLPPLVNSPIVNSRHGNFEHGNFEQGITDKKPSSEAAFTSESEVQKDNAVADAVDKLFKSKKVADDGIFQSGGKSVQMNKDGKIIRGIWVGWKLEGIKVPGEKEHTLTFMLVPPKNSNMRTLGFGVGIDDSVYKLNGDKLVNLFAMLDTSGDDTKWGKIDSKILVTGWPKLELLSVETIHTLKENFNAEIGKLKEKVPSYLLKTDTVEHIRNPARKESQSN